MEIVTHIFQVLVSLMHAGLLLIAGAIGLAILALIMRGLSGSRKQAACRKGLFQVHETTQYERTQSVKTRLAAENKEKPGTECCDSKPYAVLKFDGDVFATGRERFGRLVDELIVNADRFAGAVVVVTSPGGGVAHYGQLYAEMERLRKAGVDLTVCVDTVAASGGYLMSVPANKIVAAPFALVGSIGVVTEFVNVHQFLKNLGIEPVQMTAGKFKRTVTPTGPITEEGKKHYQEQLEAIHRLFIKAVTTYRKVDVDRVCTGDHWTASESVDLGLNLVDELATSQDYLLRLNREHELVHLSEKQSRFERGIFRFVTRLVDHLIERAVSLASGGVRP